MNITSFLSLAQAMSGIGGIRGFRNTIEHAEQ